ncbi:MAG: hypothetical protein REDVDVYQ_002406, partial [Candidatus Fervidibacter sp.]
MMREVGCPRWQSKFALEQSDSEGSVGDETVEQARLIGSFHDARFLPPSCEDDDRF